MAVERRKTVAQRRHFECAKLIGQIRGDLDCIVIKALEKNRTRRYDSASSLARDVQRHLASEPILARPVSPFYRLQRMVRRHKLAYICAVIVLGALLAGYGLTRCVSRRITRCFT